MVGYKAGFKMCVFFFWIQYFVFKILSMAFSIVYPFFSCLGMFATTATVSLRETVGTLKCVSHFVFMLYICIYIYIYKLMQDYVLLH